MANSIDIPKVPGINEVVSQVKSGKITVLELVSEHLKRAQEIDKNLNAFITVLEDDAIDKAKKIDQDIKNGIYKNKDDGSFKLLGVPFTAKDLYMVDNTRTTFGSKLMEEFTAPYTATVLQKCLDEGAILIGKTNCDPWGFGASGENSGFGPTKNPYDMERTPGGSSSGSAASLAAGIGFFSLGTDTGGSVRLPAAFCGLYSLKPTYGRNSRYGIGVMGSSFDTPGFFARHLDDVALLETIMAGKDKNDATTQEVPVNDYLNEMKNIKKVKIGVPKEFFGEGLNEEVKEAIENQIDIYKKTGFEVKAVSIPSMKYGLAVYYILVPSEISANRARYDGVRYGKKVSDDYEGNLIGSRSLYLEEEVKRRIMIGTYSLSAGYADQFYKKASKVRTKIKREFEAVFGDVDVLISPVAADTAFKLGEKTDDPVQMYLNDIYTVTANITGIPALVVPIGKDSKGLPIGMQIMGRMFEEGKVLAAANLLSVNKT